MEGVDSGVPPPLPAKRGAEGGGGGGGAAGGLNVSSITTKNLQQILNKLSLEEKSRRHDFWDTQPVPKLGEEGGGGGRERGRERERRGRREEKGKREERGRQRESLIFIQFVHRGEG